MTFPPCRQQLPPKIKGVWAVRDLLAYGLPMGLLLFSLFLLAQMSLEDTLPEVFRLAAWILIGFLGLALVL